MGLFDDLWDIATKPARDIAKTVANTAAEIFEDVTQPFLKPIDNILDHLAPRMRVDVGIRGDVRASVSGRTRHDVVFPQLGPGGANDVTGGLLSDLAFDSAELRRTEDKLDFLTSAMRRGVYPHRDDTYYVGFSAVPDEAFKGEVWINLKATFEDNGAPLCETSIHLTHLAVQRRLESVKHDLSVPGDPQPRFRPEDLASALERTERVQVPTEFSTQRKIRVQVTALDGNGAESAPLMDRLQELTVWVERRNRGYADILHHLVCAHPKQPVNVVWPLDRTSYVTSGGHNQHGAIDLNGAGLNPAADCLAEALSLLESGNDTTPGDADGSSSASIERLLYVRLRHAEAVRRKLWEARRRLRRFRSDGFRFDYRLRFKLRVTNQSPRVRSVSRITVKSSSAETGDVHNLWELNSFSIPPTSEYATTVYPIQDQDDSTTTARLEMGDTGPHLVFSLTGGLGTVEHVLATVKPISEDAQPDAGSLRWAIGDCCHHT